MEDLGERRDYPPEVAGVIRQNEISDYFAAAQQINDSGADVVWLQHEYGIFGGSAGGMILQLLDREIGRAHVCTPVTNAHLVCRLMLEKKETHKSSIAKNTT